MKAERFLQGDQKLGSTFAFVGVYVYIERLEPGLKKKKKTYPTLLRSREENIIVSKSQRIQSIHRSLSDLT